MILDSGNILTKVTPYRLKRPSDTIRIDVHQIILGSDTKFVAVPVELLGTSTTREELHVHGKSELDALEKLVEMIQNLAREDIFPKRK